MRGELNPPMIRTWFGSFETSFQDMESQRERTEERALAGLKKLGHHLIEQALGSNNPWHALKHAGSQPGCQFPLGQT